ncbi:MAG: hypothetical protein NC347_07460 [Clostridium sp.]|nr:hypothetical protein [Clostridium sp.]
MDRNEREKSRLQLTESFSEERFSVPFEEEGYTDCEWKELTNMLDAKYQEVIILYYAQGFTAREIARLLDTNQNTVLTRLARARKLLEKEYQETIFKMGGYTR